MKIAVCDDSEHCLDHMRQALFLVCNLYHLDITSIDTYTSGESLIKALNRELYSIIILDIEMEYNGIAVAKEVRKLYNEYLVKIIFCSNYYYYWKLLFDFKPVCFLSKPVSQTELSDAISKCLQQFKAEAQGYDTYILKSKNRYTRILQSDILFFESHKHYVTITLSNDIKETHFSSMSKVIKQLNQNNFLQIHKSYIVNFKYIKTFYSLSIIMTNNEEIPISKARSKEVRQRIQQIYQQEHLTK